MRGALLLMTLFVLALPAAAAADGASVKLLDCVPALEPQDRMAMFEARMTPRRGSERMQLRFALQLREPALEWRRVIAPGLDQWLTSNPGVRRYSYAKTVQNLAAPAAYRMVVRFRWLDVGGEALERDRATSRSCRQPDMRPDLGVTWIDVTPPLETGHAHYSVTLHNGGRSAAPAFRVALRVGEEELEPLGVPGLAAGERHVLTFAAPPCAPGAPLTATADALLEVDERNEDDNVLVAPCLP